MTISFEILSIYFSIVAHKPIHVLFFLSFCDYYSSMIVYSHTQILSHTVGMRHVLYVCNTDIYLNYLAGKLNIYLVLSNFNASVYSQYSGYAALCHAFALCPFVYTESFVLSLNTLYM